MARTDDRHVHLELVDTKTEEERWREEAMHKLRPRPEVQAAIKAARHAKAAKKGSSEFVRVLSFLRGRW